MNIKGKTCQSGGKKTATGRFINEDGLLTFNTNYNGKTYRFIILMDGATGLGKDHEISKGKTSAEWYVEFIMCEIKKTLSANPTLDLEEVIEIAISKAINEILKYEDENNIKLEEYEKPSAGLSLLRTDGKTTDIFLLGDTETIIAYTNGEVLKVDNPNQKALQKLDASVIRRMAEIAKERGCDVIDTRTDPEIESMLQINRAKKNAYCEGAYWVCGTTPGTAKHGKYLTLNNADIEGILLATDGFDYSILGINEKEVYELVKQYSIEHVSRAIRSKQANDARCNRYPRFKQYDDLTAASFDFERELDIGEEEQEI